MLTTILEEITTLLKKGVSKKGHSFRYCTVASVANDAMPKQRIMVLRKVTEALALVVYTDERSNKVQQLQKNPTISILFYDAKSMTQVIINGTAEKLSSEQALEFWDTVGGRAKNDYCTTQAPGTVLDNPANVLYDYSAPNFSVLRIQPEEIEYLRLKRPNHLRAKFTFANEQWNGTFLVP